jgi:beta-N-acetylhexosaminidase
MRAQSLRSRVVTFPLMIALLAGCTPDASDAETPSAAPAPPPPPPLTKAIGAPAPLDSEQVLLERTISSWTLEQRLASLIMIAAPGTDPSVARRLLDRHGFGGFIIMGSNVTGTIETTAAFVDGLSDDPLYPVLTAVDQEGGDVRRLPGDTAPAGFRLHTAERSVTEGAFASRSAIVDAAGIAINFGIVADVTADTGAFIHRRVLGETPVAAAGQVAAAVRGEQGRVLSTLKHYPGHGASPDDSHVGIPRSAIGLAEWRDTHALPFASGVDAGAELVMTGHLLFDAVSPHPASLSPTWIRILRSELGFGGVIVTDDLLMLQRSGRPELADPHENAVRALAAGNDILLFVLPADPATVGLDPDRLIARLVEAVESAEISETAIEASVRRVLALRRHASAAPAPSCGRACDGDAVRLGWRLS